MFINLQLILFILYLVFFFNDSATTEIYTLSLHDALPIYFRKIIDRQCRIIMALRLNRQSKATPRLYLVRSEEHTSELQSRGHLVCRLLLEKKKTARDRPISNCLRCI